MKRYLFVLAIAAFMLTGCKSSKDAVKERSNNEVWQTLLVKQLDANVEGQIITVKYNLVLVVPHKDIGLAERTPDVLSEFIDIVIEFRIRLSVDGGKREQDLTGIDMVP